MKKTVFKKFTLWQNETEEAWINNMASQGWLLTKVALLRYHFESGLPSEYTYKLELLDNDPEAEDSRKYLSFLQETGIEQVGQMGNWVYLRRKTADGPFETSIKPVQQLAHAIRLSEAFNKMRTLLIILAAISLLLTQIGYRIDYDANWFMFLQGVANGMGTGSMVLLIIMTPYQKKTQKHIRTLIKELAVRE